MHLEQIPEAFEKKRISIDHEKQDIFSSLGFSRHSRGFKSKQKLQAYALRTPDKLDIQSFHDEYEDEPDFIVEKGGQHNSNLQDFYQLGAIIFDMVMALYKQP